MTIQNKLKAKQIRPKQNASKIFCKRERGFSLIELLTTIGIMGTLAGVAFVSYRDTKKEAGKASIDQRLDRIGRAVESCVISSADETLTSCLSGATVVADAVSTLGLDKCSTSGASKAQTADGCYVSYKSSDPPSICFQVVNTGYSGCVDSAGAKAPARDYENLSTTLEDYKADGTLVKGFCNSSSVCVD